jgi:hypothetical protein
VTARGAGAAHRLSAVLVACVLSALAPPGAGASQLPVRTPVLDVSPAEAERTDLVTVTGVFAGEPAATVGGAPAEIVESSPLRIVLRVPSVSPGSRPVIVRTALTGPSEPIDFTVIDGRVLAGPSDAPAFAAVADDPPVGALADDVTATGLLLTRLDAALEGGATVGQVNEALQSTGARINGSLSGVPFLTLTVPRQPDAAALADLARRLASTPGFADAGLAHRSSVEALPDPPADTKVEHLKLLRFPAAWNASALLGGCDPVRVIVADHFAKNVKSVIASEIPSVVFGVDRLNDQVTNTHGGQVVTTLAADADAAAPTGAMPFGECLTIEGIQAGDISGVDAALRIGAALRSGDPAVINTSLGFFESAATPETAAERTPLRLLESALTWLAVTNGRDGRFVHATSAGNMFDKPSAAVYTGVGQARFGSLYALRGHGPSLRFPQSAELWTPTDGRWPSLVASADEVDALFAASRAGGYDPPVNLSPDVNTFTVGSVDASRAPSSFSNAGSIVSAVGEGVPTLSGPVNGTSFSAPAVAGLMAWLWLIAPDLRVLPKGVTTNVIQQTARGGVVDAYAATLATEVGSLGSSSRVRGAVADVSGDNRFDAIDLISLNDAVTRGDGTIAANLRADLNGDGHVGRNDTPAPVDVDPSSSTRHDRGTLTTLAVDIDGNNRYVDENAASDIDVLCTWAYSEMFSGDPDERSEVLGDLCSAVTVSIVPAETAMDPETTLQFTGVVGGDADKRVTWTASGGSITQQGLYTAPARPDLYTVTATSVARPDRQATARVFVGPGDQTILRYTGDWLSTRSFSSESLDYNFDYAAHEEELFEGGGLEFDAKHMVPRSRRGTYSESYTQRRDWDPGCPSNWTGTISGQETEFGYGSEPGEFLGTIHETYVYRREYYPDYECKVIPEHSYTIDEAWGSYAEFAGSRDPRQCTVTREDANGVIEATCTYTRTYPDGSETSSARVSRVWPPVD